MRFLSKNVPCLIFHYFFCDFSNIGAKKAVFAQMSKCHFATKSGFLLTLGFVNYA